MDAYPRPDWVLCGTPNGKGGVTILASTELTQAELAQETKHLGVWGGEWERNPVRPAMRIELTVTMRTYVIVTADTYEEALRHLFETWTPQQRPTRAVGPAHRAITP